MKRTVSAILAASLLCTSPLMLAKPKTRCQKLRTAARLGKLDYLKALLASGAHDTLDKNNKSALYWAGAKNHPAVIQELFDQEVSSLTQYPQTSLNMLRTMVRREYVKALSVCLKNPSFNNLSKNYRPQILSLLHTAASAGSAKAAQLLLNQTHLPLSQWLNHRKGNNKTPLRVAAHNNRPEMMQLLFAYGLQHNVAIPLKPLLEDHRATNYPRVSECLHTLEDSERIQDHRSYAILLGGWLRAHKIPIPCNPKNKPCKKVLASKNNPDSSKAPPYYARLTAALLPYIGEFLAGPQEGYNSLAGRAILLRNPTVLSEQETALARTPHTIKGIEEIATLRWPLPAELQALLR